MKGEELGILNFGHQLGFGQGTGVGVEVDSVDTAAAVIGVGAEEREVIAGDAGVGGEKSQSGDEDGTKTLEGGHGHKGWGRESDR